MPDPGSARGWRSVHGLLLWLAVALGTWPLQGQIRSLGYAQRERSSIHMLELEAHRGVVVDYARADSIAATMPPPPLPRAFAPVKEVVGYLPYWKYSSDSYNYTMLDYSLLTQINYFCVELDSAGNITDHHGWPRTEFISFAHARGIKVKLCATIPDIYATGKMAALLNSPTYRQRAIDNLLAAVRDAGADGVDIDFEPMPAGQKANMVTFMRDLTDAFHTNIPGSIVTLAMPAVDWGGDWDYSTLADIVDGMFIMAYDYHWRGGPTAGPVSPLDGFSRNVTWTVNDYLTKTGNDTAKLILGLPYYGYDWPVKSSAKYDSTTGSASARIYTVAYDMARTHGRLWDQVSSTPWFNYQDNGVRQVWYDDSLSLSMKYELAQDSDLAGVGMWALGFDGDRTELWGALANYLRRIPAPIDLVADMVDQTVELRWSHSDEEALTYYRVYRYTLPLPESAHLIATIQKDSTAYVDSGAVYGVTFYYWVSAVDTLGNESELSASVSARPRDQSQPYILYQIYPNPFRGITLILFDLSEAGNVRLSVYDLRGALVRTLVSGYRGEDSYTYPFLPVDAAGRQLAAGIYFVTLRVDEGKPDMRKMVLLR